MRGINLRLPYLETNFERPSQKTDLLVEQTLTSFSTDHESNSLFDLKTTGNILRSFSSIGQEAPERMFTAEMHHRLEEELKRKNSMIKELQNNNHDLRNLIKQLQDEKDEIVNVNIKLTKELENTIEKYERLSLRVQASPRHFEVKNNEVYKYSQFIVQKCKNLKEVSGYFEDRLGSRSLVEIVSKDRDRGLLVCLQVLSDIIVHCLSGGKNEGLKSPSSKGVIEENETLLNSISEHNFRIARLNKEIARSSVIPDCMQSIESLSKSPTPILKDGKSKGSTPMMLLQDNQY